MNIRNLQISADRAETYRQHEVHETGRAAGGSDVKRNATAPAQDRVEISDAARAAGQNAETTEVHLAKKALLGIPPLSDKRAADILARIQSGYYSQPDVLRQIAERVGNELLPPEQDV